MDKDKNPDTEENYEFDDLDVNIHFNDGEEPKQNDEEEFFDDEECDYDSDCECHHGEHNHAEECHHHHHHEHKHNHSDTEDEEEEDNTCDLDPTKICNNCGACLNFANMDEKGYASILIDQIDTDNVSLDELYEMYGLDQDDED